MGEGWLSWAGDKDKDLGLTVNMTKGLGSGLVSGILTVGPSAPRHREMRWEGKGEGKGREGKKAIPLCRCASCKPGLYFSSSKWQRSYKA